MNGPCTVWSTSIFTGEAARPTPPKHQLELPSPKNGGC
jgi:hypothetical protein